MLSKFYRKYAILPSSKGFTLLEILAVLMIIALLVGVAAPAIFSRVRKGRVEATKVQINGLEQSLNSFNLDCGFFPSTEQTLESLITPPTIGRACKNYDPDGYLKKKTLPKDPWSKDFIYVAPGKQNPSSYDLSSSGPDGVEGNEDDIKSWE